MIFLKNKIILFFIFLLSAKFGFSTLTKEQYLHRFDSLNNNFEHIIIDCALEFMDSVKYEFNNGKGIFVINIVTLTEKNCSFSISYFFNDYEAYRVHPTHYIMVNDYIVLIKSRINFNEFPNKFLENLNAMTIDTTILMKIQGKLLNSNSEGSATYRPVTGIFNFIDGKIMREYEYDDVFVPKEYYIFD